VRNVIAVTCGEPAGIGPEVSLRAAWALRHDVDCVLIGDAAFLAALASDLDPAMHIQALSAQAMRNSGLPELPLDRLAVIDCPAAEPIVPGRLDPRNSMAVLQALDVAMEGIRQGCFDAIVTAPLQKSTINEAGIAFTGHTEYFARKTGTAHVVMMLAGGEPLMRVALATTHLALKDVPGAITIEGLERTLGILQHELRHKFGLAQPRILVAGLNPHAGEGGYLGREEIDVIIPALKAAQARGIDASGPYPADTLFQPKYLERADCILAMYHDQGLPVLKHASFGGGVNITLGLPLIRTSADHGTALDLAAAGIGLADHGSMMAAIRQAALMVRAAHASLNT
jgi:4-hydroxythreonine-4-phosphate dehydrogenase